MGYVYLNKNEKYFVYIIFIHQYSSESVADKIRANHGSWIILVCVRGWERVIECMWMGMCEGMGEGDRVCVEGYV